jgi:hypothetical protein
MVEGERGKEAGFGVAVPPAWLVALETRELPGGRVPAP